MDDLLLRSKAQMRRIEPCFPLSHGVASHGVARVDDRRVLSGILFVIRNGLRWRDAPAGYGPHKTIYTASSAGAGLVYSTRFSPSWRRAATPRTG